MELLFLPAHDFGFCKQIAYATTGVSGSDDYQPHFARLPHSHNAWYLVMLSYPVDSLVPEKLQDLLQHNVVPNFPISALWDSHWSWLLSGAWLTVIIAISLCCPYKMSHRCWHYAALHQLREAFPMSGTGASTYKQYSTTTTFL